MTAPRQILPGVTYLVTRRCAQRQFLLKPSEKTTNPIFLYLLAVAARRYAIQVHAYCVLSNHFHMIVTDTGARLPAFHQFLDALVARALNASLGRWEAFWSPNSYSAVKLVSPEDVIDKAAYVLANPVAAGLVAVGSIWPGLWSSPERISGEALIVQRPRGFFDPDGPLPDEVSLELSTPPGFSCAAEFRDAVGRALAVREEKARTIWAARGGFAGVRRVLAQRVESSARREEQHRTLKPRIATKDRWKRIEALGRLLEFVHAYRAALEAWRAGEPDVTFPAGTYHMRIAHAVRCAGFP